MSEGITVTNGNPFQEVERVLDVVSQGLGADLVGIQVDVIDEDDAYVLRADVPGVDPGDVEVRVSDGHEVTVDVTTDQETEVSDRDFVVRERTHRSTSRTVTLPSPVEESEASATVDAGVLEVRLPKLTVADEGGTDIPVE